MRQKQPCTFMARASLEGCSLGLKLEASLGSSASALCILCSWSASSLLKEELSGTPPPLTHWLWKQFWLICDLLKDRDQNCFISVFFTQAKSSYPVHTEGLIDEWVFKFRRALVPITPLKGTVWFIGTPSISSFNRQSYWVPPLYIWRGNTIQYTINHHLLEMLTMCQPSSFYSIPDLIFPTNL